MSFVPCSWDAYMDNYGSCFKPCYEGYLSQILDNGTCGTNYTTIAASTSKSTLKCICENAHGVSDTWSKAAWECSYTRCDNLTGSFNYTTWIDSVWSYDDLCAYARGTEKCTSAASALRLSTAGALVGLLALSHVLFV
ncbi:hypothetical protein AbraIFM66950_005036 [Aspergillus brasiliensis]|nr:hypothetical protein AbraIFM66950_005036 [Aspergillus brasiliensis]